MCYISSDNYHLVKSPQNRYDFKAKTLSHSQKKADKFVNCTELLEIWFQSSSGETVTSLVSVSPALPKKERRYKKKRSKDNLEEVPPEIPVKGKQERPGAHTAILLLVCFFCLFVFMCFYF